MKSTNNVLIAFAVAAAAIAFIPSCRADGLDSIKDDKLFTELSNRGMDEMLDRAFDVDKTPPDKRETIRAIASLSRMTSHEKMTPEELQAAIKNITAAIDKILPSMQNDPQGLIDLAQKLVSSGIDREVGILEYWGDSEAERTRLKPIAQAAMKVYDQAAKSASAAADKIADKIQNANDTVNQNAWDKMNGLANGSIYQKLRTSYALALSMDKTDPARAKLIEDALKDDTGLPQWNNPDSGIMAAVRLEMAKFNVLKDDNAAATKLLDSIIKNDKADIQPPATDGLIFEARCYKVVAALAAENVANAQAALKDAQSQGDLAKVPQNDAALKLLNYRILALIADKAPPKSPEKDKANAVAVKELGNLLTEIPDLRKVIFEQLLYRMDANPDYPKLDPMLLLALMQKGRSVVVGTAADKLDADQKKDLQRGHDAVTEIIARGPKVFDKAVIADAMLLHGIFHEYLGQKLPAVTALLDYVEAYSKTPDNKAQFALDHAESLIGELQSASPVDSNGNRDRGILDAEERFMKDAIDVPFNQKKWALQYAGLLRKDKKFTDAIKYFKMVPDTDPPGDVFRARYWELICIKSELDDDKNLKPADRPALIARVQELAKVIHDVGDKYSKDPATKPVDVTFARSSMAFTALVTADIVRVELKDPQRVLDALADFENSVEGLANAKDLLKDALKVRVEAYMALGKNDLATESLRKFMQAGSGDEGIAMIKDLLSKLIAELKVAQGHAESARASNDPTSAEVYDKQIRQIADNCSMLIVWLSDWAAKNPDPKYKFYAYTLRRFSAEITRLSASVETDPELRKKKYNDALDIYKQLATPENVALYKASLTEDQNEKSPDDVRLNLDRGLVEYDLQDWKEAVAYLNPLVSNSKLGEDNDDSWEATYKLLNALHQLAKAGVPDYSDDPVQKSIKTLYLIWRDDTGGKNYHAQFEALRKEVLPNWEIGITTQPSTPATTQK